MNGTTMEQGVDEAIVALLDRLATAHAARDADAIAAAYSEDAVIYDMAPPLGRRGIDRDRVARWLATWDGPIRMDMQDREITQAGSMACVAALGHMRGEKSGEAQDIWYRATWCLRRFTDGWRIVTDHASVPFYMDGSNRAAVDLAP